MGSKFRNFVFLLIIASYAVLIVIDSNLQVIDDHMLLDNLMIGKPFKAYWSENLFKIGRFYPLNMQEFNLMNLFISSPDVKYFYLLISFEFLILCYLFFKIFKKLGIYNKLFPVIITILIFSPAFVTAFFRLHIGERSVLLFFTIFLYSFLEYHKKSNFIYLLLSLISANIALYYKEPAFLMLGSFAFFHLAFGWKELNIKQKIYDVILIFSSLIFISIYYFVVYRYTQERYGTVNINPLIQFIKNLLNYALNDPLIVMILIPIGAWRIVTIIKTKKQNYVYDSLLFSSIIYALAIFILNIPFNFHYLLPVYGFGLPALVYYLFKEHYYKRVSFKILLALSIVIFIGNSLPTGLHSISHYKNVPNNYQKVLNFLVEYIKKENAVHGKRVSLFILGVNKGAGLEVQHSFIRYLIYYGLTPEMFDVKTEENIYGLLKPKTDPQSPFTIFKSNEPSPIMPGDLVILTPYTTKYTGLDKQEIYNMESKGYELLYHAKSHMEIPLITIKTAIKGIARSYKDSLKDSKAMISENIYQLPLDFYVFRKK